MTTLPASGPHSTDGRKSNIRDLLANDGGSELARYRSLTCPGSWLRFVMFELATLLLLPLGGALGLALRRSLLRPFFGELGRKVIIGRNCTFRHPHRIFIADGVAIDDNCLIDARGSGDAGVRLAAGVILSRGVQVKSKRGGIFIGRAVNVGDDTKISSESGIRIGAGAGIAGGCIIAGGTFPMREFNRPARQRTSVTQGPIQIGAGTWLASGVMILDAVQIGENTIVSAGSVVTRSLPARCVAHGNPASKVFDIR